MSIDDCKVQIHSDGSMATVFRVATGYMGRGYTNLDEVPIHLRESLYAVPSNDLRDAFFCSQQSALQMIDWLEKGKQAEIEAKERDIRELEEQLRLSRSISLAAVGAKIDINTLASMTEERFAEELAALTEADDKRKADVAEEAAHKAILDAEFSRREQLLGWIPDDAMMCLTVAEFDDFIADKRIKDEKRKADEARAEAFRREQEELKRTEAIKEALREEAEAKAAAEEAERIAALAPDREKVDAYLNDVRGITVPTLESEESQVLLANLVDDFIDDLRVVIGKLERGSL